MPPTVAAARSDNARRSGTEMRWLERQALALGREQRFELGERVCRQRAVTTSSVGS